MKRILGLDLGTSSIGWAVVDQAVEPQEKSKILKGGVRVNPLTVDEKGNFETGKSITTTADRTSKRGMRRNLQRYKLRRDTLISKLKSYGWITDKTILSEEGNFTTFETFRLRAKAASECVTLEELSRVLLMINKKRGYKSNRKANNEEEGELIDGMAIAKRLYDEKLTPGQLVYEIRKSGKRFTPSFYRSDLQMEFNLIWDCQAKAYPDVLTADLKEKMLGKNKKSTENMFYAIRHLNGADLKKDKERAITMCRWRSEAVSKVLDLPQVVTVLASVNGDIANSSGYLGAISDRSKELWFAKKTVGQYLMENLDKDPHFRVKNRVFYRQDYLNEFEQIWETQKQFHSELTDELKHEIRDIVIFYQRKLKSQKSLIGFCEFESKQIEVKVGDKKKRVMTGLKVSPKSAPLFQEFRIWQELCHVALVSKTDFSKTELTQEQRELLYKELRYVKELKKTAVLKLLKVKSSAYDLNYEKIDGNATAAALLDAAKKVAEWSGHDLPDFDKMDAENKLSVISQIFDALGFCADFLTSDDALEKMWHLLYSYEGDSSSTGNVGLAKHLMDMTGITEDYISAFVNVKFEQDYGSLSAKAMKKILPHLRKGMTYDKACAAAGYRHSKSSLTKEENDSRILKERLELLPKNSLRNPVVEKILNQMVHVVNGCIDQYGAFDEIHIELARELKQNQKQREQATSSLRARTKETDDIKARLQKDFGIAHPSRADVVRYRLYEELKDNGYRTLYSNTYISQEKLFSRDFDIEHILPQAKVFDDSFGNKTIETRSINQEKGNMTARDYVLQKYGEDGLKAYEMRVKATFGKSNPHKAKQLMLAEADIESGFLNRDLSDSQYIAKAAKAMLVEITRRVVHTSGSITARLRDDWQLVDVMKELNWDKYDKRGLTETYRNRDGHEVRRINDWTKRNDHRHHAMDALTIAFTQQAHIQLLNNLNARDKGEMNGVDYALVHKQLTENGKFRMPMDDFRGEAKKMLEAILVSIKAKNKVATPSTNKVKTKIGVKKQVTLTPRGQLHNETVYGERKRYVTKEEAVGAKFTAEKIATVCRKDYREALLNRLLAFEGDAKKAFTGKNSLDKNTLWLDELHTRAVPSKVKTVVMESYFTIRKAISPDLKIDKVTDVGVKRILKQRLDAFGGDPKQAFSNLDENPIWLNEDRGIAIKNVTITGVSVATPLHGKRDKNGALVLDGDSPVANDYVSTSNNHHVAIFEDAKGDYHEHIVSLYEAMACVSLGLPVVDKEYNKEQGWKFLFTMKKNEYFVLPDLENGFNPEEIDLLDEANASRISPHLFRVQKLASGNYFFRHHLETTVETIMELRGVTWERIRNENKLKGFVKVRVDHNGKIVAVGEY